MTTTARARQLHEQALIDYAAQWEQRHVVAMTTELLRLQEQIDPMFRHAAPLYDPVSDTTLE